MHQTVTVYTLNITVSSCSSWPINSSRATHANASSIKRGTRSSFVIFWTRSPWTAMCCTGSWTRAARCHTLTSGSSSSQVDSYHLFSVRACVYVEFRSDPKFLRTPAPRSEQPCSGSQMPHTHLLLLASPLRLLTAHTSWRPTDRGLGSGCTW